MKNKTYTMLGGGTGYEMSPELALYAQACTSLMVPTYYIPSTNDQLNRIKANLSKVDPYFAAQLAVYVREQMNLRTLPLVLTVELAKIHRGDNLIRRLSRRVIKRADELVNIVELYTKANSLKPREGTEYSPKKIYKLSNQLKRGIADAFHNFDEYQFSKYNRPGEIKLRDVMFLTHPKPRNAAERELFNRIANDNLETAYTWETQMSQAGQTGRDKKEVWVEMINSGRMNYMSMLRNLRNFLKEDLPEDVLMKVADYISNPRNVRNSKQLPFRFLSAYRMLGGQPNTRYGHPTIWGAEPEEKVDVSRHPMVGAFLEALELAVIVSADNMPIFRDETALLASDVSGSMQQPVSEKSVIQNFDIGILLAMIAQVRCNSATVGMFGNIWKPIDSLPRERILAATNEMHRREGEVGYSTHGYKVLEWALGMFKRGMKYDRVMIFTDCQLYGGPMQRLWEKYKSLVPESKLYLFNLSPYGEVPIKVENNGAHLISGWSDKVFNVVEAIENGESALQVIRSIEV